MDFDECDLLQRLNHFISPLLNLSIKVKDVVCVCFHIVCVCVCESADCANEGDMHMENMTYTHTGSAMTTENCMI